MRETEPKSVLMTADTVGGVWTYSLDLARGLTARGINVVLATMGAPMSTMQREEAASVRGLHVVESSFKLEWMQEPWADVEAAGRWLLELEHQFKPDIIHLNGYAHGALPWKAPVLVVGHSCVLSWWRAVKNDAAPSLYDEYRRRVGEGLRGATFVTAPTRAMLGALSEHYGTLPTSRVLHNGRSSELFSRPGEKQNFIFAAGRLGDEAKNIQALGQAAAGLSWPVFVAGAKQDASGAQPLPPNVTHCGQLGAAALAERMRAASIYCLPARYEPFGLSILEAAHAGCTLVLGDIPTLRELWEGCACFVPPDDPQAIHKELKLLITDPVRRALLADAAQKHARTFSHDRFVENYLTAYQNLLSNQHARQSLAA